MDGNTVLIAITNAHVLRLFPRMKSPQCSILLCLFLLGSAANNKRKSRFFIGEMHYFLLQVRRTLSGRGYGFARCSDFRVLKAKSPPIRTENFIGQTGKPFVEH